MEDNYATGVCVNTNEELSEDMRKVLVENFLALGALVKFTNGEVPAIPQAGEVVLTKRGWKNGAT